MQAQSDQVSSFFNQIAGEYREKYGDRDVFLNYFFQERLVEACRGLDFDQKRILDVGAGTGNLYDYLLSFVRNIDYHATDIAENMLRQSNIPSDRQHVGTLSELDLPTANFDYIFVLGVTTYLDDEELSGLMGNIRRLLHSNGKAIITFTNSSSFDWKLRSAFRRMPIRRLSRRSVISQGFRVYARSVADIREMAGDGFEVDEIRWLNHTVFPLNQIFKGPSVKIAKRIHVREMSVWMERVSSDFLAIITKK